MNLTFRENYWQEPDLKKEFISFLIRIHRLDLSLWDRLGYWDDNYRPFSYFDGDRLASSLCVYSMDMTVMGGRARVAQISAVGTDQKYQRRGLNRRLTEKAIEWASGTHDFFFLFADEGAFAFYEKCGFRRTLEHKAAITVAGAPPRSGAEKLDIENPGHRELIHRLAAARAPVSDMLGVHNEKLLMFWCLYFLRDNIYHIADLDTVVLCVREDRRLTIFDIVGAEMPAFEDIYPHIGSGSDELAEFMFMTDKLNLQTPPSFTPVEGNGTHLMGVFPLESSNFIFPSTSHA
ncbi:MAG: GNAT family N-acetyltransferase [Candidatus Zixiibacteriota bacterium]|nr:MAG: GNAT family N-acetyltransferase [candidate division Zixibacteria bacterium]